MVATQTVVQALIRLHFGLQRGVGLKQDAIAVGRTLILLVDPLLRSTAHFVPWQKIDFGLRVTRVVFVVQRYSQLVMSVNHAD